MAKSIERYIWTDKAEKMGSVIAGETATVGGRPLKEGQLARNWEKRGYVVRAKSE